MIQSTPRDEVSGCDWEALNATETELLPEQIQQAARLSQTIHRADQRWQVYLSALGAFSFEHWIADRAPDLTLDLDLASIWRPLANLLSAVCSVRVGGFKLCLISVGSSAAEIEVPIAALDLPEFAAHFYVIMQVLEEETKAAVLGFFTYEQYRQASLQADQDWTYSIPIAWLNFDANALLLNLRCLETSAVRLPAIDVARSSAALRDRISELRSALQSQPPWNILSRDEGLTLISDPALMQAVFETPSANLGLWLNNRLDAVAQAFGWVLMPPVAQTRSRQAGFDKIRSSLKQQGVQIPATARGAYRTLRSIQGSLRLYAVTWMLPEQSEWTLLIAIGAEPDASIPSPLRLEVRDDAQLLFERTLNETEHSILYAQVIGDWSEQFQVTIAIADHVFDIPKFSFDLDRPA